MEERVKKLIQFSRYPAKPNFEIVYGQNISHSLSRHVHGSFCITAIINGARKCIAENRNFIISGGETSIMAPDVMHACRSETESYSYITICISPESVNEYLEQQEISMNVNVNIPFHCGWNDELYKSILQLGIGLGEEKSNLEVEAIYNSFMDVLLPCLLKSKSIRTDFGRNKEIVNLVCEYLTENFDKSILLKDISHIVNVSPFYLTRIFSDTVGVPPHLFQNLIRINRAKKLLKSCHHMTDVATQVGFSDQSHFIHMFKKIVGMTPKEYRKGINR